MRARARAVEEGEQIGVKVRAGEEYNDQLNHNYNQYQGHSGGWGYNQIVVTTMITQNTRLSTCRNKLILASSYSFISIVLHKKHISHCFIDRAGHK